MSRAIPPLPNMPSWYGAQFKKRTGTPLPLPLTQISDVTDIQIVLLYGAAVALVSIVTRRRV
jgi:hypothetical protein